MWFKPHLLDFCDFAVGKVNDHDDDDDDDDDDE